MAPDAALFLPRRVAQLIVFWTAVAALTLCYALLLPIFFAPRSWCLAIVRSFLRSVLWLLRAVLGLRWEIRGSLNAAKGAVLVAAKHQSGFETLILQYILEDPVIILKRELLSIPLFGWALRRLGHIGVDRSGDLESARHLLGAARQAHAQGRPVLIFPEGSRREVGAPPDYKRGVELLYAILKCDCVPVAVNSGRVWPARSLAPRAGLIVLEFLPPIGTGLPRAAFRQRLQSEIEEATGKLAELRV